MHQPARPWSPRLSGRGNGDNRSCARPRRDVPPRVCPARKPSWLGLSTGTTRTSITSWRTRCLLAWRVRSLSRATSTGCPGIAGVPERLLLLGVTRLDGRGHVAPGDETRTAPFQRLVNGQPYLTLRLRARSRHSAGGLGNISPDTFFRCSLAATPCTRSPPTATHWTPRRAGRSITAWHPGKRAEVLVQGGAPGSYDATEPVRWTRAP